MVKRSFMVLVLAAVVVGGLCAQEAVSEKPKKVIRASIGGGLVIGGDFGGGVSTEVKTNAQSIYSMEFNTPNFGGGGPPCQDNCPE
jgi:hypothetical protein